MSDTSKKSDAPEKEPLGNPRLQIPRPVFQRETTFDSSEWQNYTPKTSHGFIAMHTSTPEDMHQNRSTGKPTAVNDYFSVTKQQHMLSPNPAPYEAHGFLPLCSVAAVEVEANPPIALLPNDIAQKYHIKERNPISVLNRALEQMLREVAAVCDRALETFVGSNVPANTENAFQNTAGREDATTTSQLSTDQSDASEIAHAS